MWSPISFWWFQNNFFCHPRFSVHNNIKVCLGPIHLTSRQITRWQSERWVVHLHTTYKDGSAHAILQEKKYEVLERKSTRRTFGTKLLYFTDPMDSYCRSVDMQIQFFSSLPLKRLHWFSSCHVILSAAPHAQPLMRFLSLSPLPAIRFFQACRASHSRFLAMVTRFSQNARALWHPVITPRQHPLVGSVHTGSSNLAQNSSSPTANVDAALCLQLRYHLTSCWGTATKKNVQHMQRAAYKHGLGSYVEPCWACAHITNAVQIFLP